MKGMEFNIDNRVFGGVVGVIADSLGRKPAEAAARVRQPSNQHAARPSPGDPDVPANSLGALQQLGRWFLRHQTDGVGAEIARSRDIFESLDRWLWKQQMRETEAYLAQSKDIFELEARMRRLERGPSHI